MSHNLGNIRYSLDHDKRILFATRFDDLSKERVYAEWKAMQELDGFDPAYDTIVDYSHITDLNMEMSDLLELNEQMPNHDPRTGNIAIVSGLKQGRYLLARLFCKVANITGARKHQVFHNTAEAELWLLNLRSPH